jgi:hypothetical protein
VQDERHNERETTMTQISAGQTRWTWNSSYEVFEVLTLGVAPGERTHYSGQVTDWWNVRMPDGSTKSFHPEYLCETREQAIAGAERLKVLCAS